MTRPSLRRQTLSHQAMATTFSIVVVHGEPGYARQAAAAAFAELEELESQLSRFTEASDVWRINRLPPGACAVVTRDTYGCLAAAMELRARTGGAFDITYASAPDSPPDGRLELQSAGCRVRVLAQGVRVDLGGIGKGYALDRMATVLREWDVNRALLAASTSTVLALDPPPDEPGWSVRLGPDHDSRHLKLSRAALSGSGIGVKGNHLLDPRPHEPARRRVRAWARTPSAAQADALSTAFMVMNWDEVHQYCCAAPAVEGYLLDAPGALVRACGA